MILLLLHALFAVFIKRQGILKFLVLFVCLPFFTTVNRFGELIRKIWNPRNFKAHVSPHEMLQVCLPFTKHTPLSGAVQFRVKIQFWPSSCFVVLFIIRQ